ncbi:MAG: hypothetical protein ACTSWF_03465 [Candidatus Freyarchaeota archaeon]
MKRKLLLTALLLALVSLTCFSLMAVLSQPSSISYAVLGASRSGSVYSKSDQLSLLFITGGGNNYFSDWQGVLQGKGFTLTQVYLDTLVDNPSVADAFDVLVLGSSCEGLTQSEAQTIAGIGKPVLAVGKGGYEFLNHLGAQITPLQVNGETGVHVLSVTTSYNGWDMHYHIVYQHPDRVEYTTNYLYGDVTQRYFMLPLNSDDLTLAESPNLIPLARDTTKANDYFLSIYNNYTGNPYLVHWALYNITTISRDPLGERCLKTLTNTLHWLKNKNPYTVRIEPERYQYNSMDVVNISISAVDNLNLTLHGGVTLNITVTDENQSTVHTDQVTTSPSGPVYTSFQLPAVPSPTYTVNATDGELCFLENFTVQPTDYRITTLTATPGTTYLGEGAVQLSARVTVEGTPAPDAYVLWSAIDRLKNPNAAFGDNPQAFTLLGASVTNETGHATYNWVPGETGVYEVVAWIRSYDGSPKNWTSTQVTVRGKPEISLSLTGTDLGVITGYTLRIEGNLTLNSKPLGETVSINVTIHTPDGRVVNQTIHTGSAGRFLLEWTPTTPGIHTIICSFAGNSTVDSVTRVLESTVYRLVTPLETSATDGRVTLGETIRVTASFAELGFTPNPGDPVTLMVLNLDGYTVFSGEYTVTSTEQFQAQWTPQHTGDYRIMLRFNRSYTIVATTGTIRVTSAGGFYPAPETLGMLSLAGSNNHASVPTVLAVAGSGLLGSVILLTRLRNSRDQFLRDWQQSEYDPDVYEGEEGEEDQSD